jgi:hypothetical protein
LVTWKPWQWGQRYTRTLFPTPRRHLRARLTDSKTVFPLASQITGHRLRSGSSLCSQVGSVVSPHRSHVHPPPNDLTDGTSPSHRVQYRLALLAIVSLLRSLACGPSYHTAGTYDVRMSTHRFTIDVEVDDLTLQEHLDAPPEQGGDRPPFTAPDRWESADLFSAYDEGFLVHTQLASGADESALSISRDEIAELSETGEVTRPTSGTESTLVVPEEECP